MRTGTHICSCAYDPGKAFGGIVAQGVAVVFFFAVSAAIKMRGVSDEGKRAKC